MRGAAAKVQKIMLDLMLDSGDSHVVKLAEKYKSSETHVQVFLIAVFPEVFDSYRDRAIVELHSHN